MIALRLTEIFFSLQGESTLSGLPTIFVRLTGCPLRCGYCDTAYAFKGGNKHSFEDILTLIKTYPCKRVCVTGGEPLAQKACFPFLSFLADAGYTVSLETSGAIDIQDVDPRTMIVMDLKTPDSLEESKNIYDNISYLKPKDQIKFVICSEKDYEWSKQILTSYHIPRGVELLFSPSFAQVEPLWLAESILKDGLDVRLQIQLHKLLWQDSQGK
ncbi:MAG: 7-carboxy-7-deazaguanine synthase QueE [Gammaproteobacteria bacterium]|nr:7-carboxy-7-deazaguanine synthase QueE [Gammaproteobacteria bacterium]